MLSFKKVLEVFSDYLTKDKMYEVVMTSRGYIVLGWDEPRREWAEAVFCGTPEMLLESLLDSYANYTEAEITGGKRDLTDAEQAQICKEQEALAQQCREGDIK